MTETTAVALIRPVAKPDEMLVLHDELTAIIHKNLEEKLDYGPIPGAGDKPVLLKAGAEKLCLAFGLVPEMTVVEQERDHDREVRWVKKKKVWNNKFQGDKTFRFDAEDGVSIGLYRYVIRCDLKRGERVVGSCIGVCSSLESKYIDRPRDSENTVMKMAQKRAMVGATLGTLALSNRFTQDIEDIQRDVVVEVKATPKETSAPKEDLLDPKAIYVGQGSQRPVLGNLMRKANVAVKDFDTCNEAMLAAKLQMSQLQAAVYEWVDTANGVTVSQDEIDQIFAGDKERVKEEGAPH